MSLFKVRDIWYRQLPGNWDECFSHLKVVKLLNHDEYNHFIVVASSSGILYLYYPHNHVNSNKSEIKDLADLCLEHNTNDYITDIGNGRFIIRDKKEQNLIVLHPRKVTVYGLLKTSDTEERDLNTDIIQSWTLELILEHKFTKHSYNMCVFHHSDDEKLDFICVQMTDGCIQIFGASGITRNLSLPNTLLPGPVICLREAQVIVTISSARMLSAFGGFANDSMQSIHSAYSEKLRLKPQIVNPEWTLLFGEPIFDLAVAEPDCNCSSNPSSCVIVLGRRQLFIVSDQGSILSTRRFDCGLNGVCVYGYDHNTSGNILSSANQWEPRYIVTTENKQMLILKGIQLVWCAQLPWSPTAISMPFTPFVPKTSLENLPRIGANFTPGLIACLNSNGILSLMYLGTDVSSPLGPQPNSGPGSSKSVIEPDRDLNYEQLDLEMDDLNRRIREIITNIPLNSKCPTLPCQSSVESSVTDSIHIFSKLRSKPESDLCGHSECLIDVYMTSKNMDLATRFDCMFLTAQTSVPLRVSPNHSVIPRSVFQLTGDGSISSSNNFSYRLCTLTCDLDAQNPLASQPLLDLRVRITIGFKLKSNTDELSCSAMQFINTSLKLPLCLFAQTKVIERLNVRGVYKLTFQLKTDSPLMAGLRLADLLPTLWPPKSSGSTLCVRSGSDKSPFWVVYVLFNSKKYQIRFQTDQPAAFRLLVEELLTSIGHLIKSRGIPISDGPFIMLTQTESKADSQTSELDRFQLTQFINYLEDQLRQHVINRLDVATRAASITVRARHLRPIQLQVLTRTKDIIPTSLNGFDLLLQANLNALCRHCQLVQQGEAMQLVSGASLLAVTSLVTFLSAHMTGPKRYLALPTPSDDGGSGDLFEPGRLMTIVETNNFVEVCRGNTTLPEHGAEESDNRLTPDQYMGLEECLQLQILTLLELFGASKLSDPQELLQSISSKQICTNQVPEVDVIRQQLEQLCVKLVQFGYDGLVGLFEEPRIPANLVDKCRRQVTFHQPISQAPKMPNGKSSSSTASNHHHQTNLGDVHSQQL